MMPSNLSIGRTLTNVDLYVLDPVAAVGADWGGG